MSPNKKVAATLAYNSLDESEYDADPSTFMEPEECDMEMDLQSDAIDEDSWWLQEADNQSVAQSEDEDDSFGDFKQAESPFKLELPPIKVEKQRSEEVKMPAVNSYKLEVYDDLDEEPAQTVIAIEYEESKQEEPTLQQTKHSAKQKQEHHKERKSILIDSFKMKNRELMMLQN